MKRLIIDTSNVIFRVASAHGKSQNFSSPEEQAGLAMHSAITTINKYYKKYKPDHMTLTFEGGKNWRKEYTRSDACISKMVYKANRVRNAELDAIFQMIGAFEDLVRTHSSITCLSAPLLEGDDLFAGYVQRYSNEFPDDEIIGVSGDKDFVQLLKHKNFTLINPDKDKKRLVEDVCGVDDPVYFMFEKAFRGDSGDNVMTAYPRVQKKRLLKCLSDEYELTKIMNETWTFTDKETEEIREYRVGDLFEENNLLMNLEMQPPEIRTLIDETIDAALGNPGKFSLFQFSKFCGKYGLKQIADNATNYADMFSANTPKKQLQEEVQTSPRKKALLEF